MKRRMNIILVAILVMIVAIMSLLAGGQKTALVAVPAPAIMAAPTTVPVLRIVVQAQRPDAPTATPQVEPTGVATPVANTAGYTAVAGDTLGNVAAGLLGSDTKANRDAVIAANPSLQSDPDRVLSGKTYFLAASDATIAPTPVSEAPTAGVPAAIVPATSPTESAAAPADSDRVLKYTAQTGDSVSVLAAGLLGGDSQTNRDAIIAHNQTLQDNPDRVVTGKTYIIPTSAGLSAAAVSPAAATATPTTQPDADADQVVKMSASRELRYTAIAGDSVSKLAVVLLGSDTQANRDAIIDNNASLKNDPDRVVAGQTYWIPVPVAAVK